MLYNILLFISIIIIFHFLWNYIKDTFTVKKKKYINTEIDKYRQLLDTHISNTNITTDLTDELQNDLELFLQNNI
jgi:hypothetical protein